MFIGNGGNVAPRIISSIALSRSGWPELLITAKSMTRPLGRPRSEARRGPPRRAGERRRDSACGSLAMRLTGYDSQAEFVAREPRQAAGGREAVCGAAIAARRRLGRGKDGAWPRRFGMAEDRLGQRLAGWRRGRFRRLAPALAGPGLGIRARQQAPTVRVAPARVPSGGGGWRFRLLRRLRGWERGSAAGRDVTKATSIPLVGIGGGSGRHRGGQQKQSPLGPPHAPPSESASGRLIPLTSTRSLRRPAIPWQSRRG